ncbi:MAG TPA: imidazolonepropionase, partial [Phycisphaerales bacterium]|nr:imidazolonepropionase [Phycisphaerales bacterium]
GGGPGRGTSWSTLRTIPRADILIEGGVIVSITEGPSAMRAHGASLVMLDAGGRVLMPGFVDAHTHALWVGDRLDEWDQKRRGVPYLDILKAGGGIMSTVRAVRRAGPAELEHALRARLRA